MSANAYLGTEGRTFGAALLHLLESEYGLLGSRKVLELLSADVTQLVEQFYPPPEHLASGWMVFTGTRASGDKVHPGQYAHEHELVTIAWPLLLAEDVQFLATHPESIANLQTLASQRLVRLIEYGAQHPAGPVLLTVADLAVLLGLETVQVSLLLKQARLKTGKPLPTLGYFFDQGMKPSHKAEVIALYEAGCAETEVARRSGPALKSVGKYIADYERVKKLLAHHTPLADIPVLLQMQPGVVRAYAGMVELHHPDLLETPPDRPNLSDR